MLIINADDLGRSREVTDSILRCAAAGVVTSASAMVFMTDSRRAAGLALTAGLDTGLHLNLDLPFDAPDTPPELRGRQLRMVRHFRRGRWPQVVYDPFIRKDLAHLVQAQSEEYRRLYGAAPDRIDGHHHLHLCANVFRDRLLPPGAIVRRSFTFGPGEKGPVNRAYRRWIDRRLERRHLCVRAFHSLVHLRESDGLGRVVGRAWAEDIEIMVHPGVPAEEEFLLGPRLRALLGDCPRGPFREARFVRGSLTCP